MKKDQNKTKRDVKLILNKESVRKLPGSGLSDVAGGAGVDTLQAKTVTFPLCCRTA